MLPNLITLNVFRSMRCASLTCVQNSAESVDCLPHTAHAYKQRPADQVSNEIASNFILAALKLYVLT